jgi:hypothetical protein
MVDLFQIFRRLYFGTCQLAFPWKNRGEMGNPGERKTHVFDRPGIVQEILSQFVGILFFDYNLGRLDNMPAVFDQHPAAGRELALVDASDQIDQIGGPVLGSRLFTCQLATHGECCST